MNVLGIDVGLKGALALVGEDGTILARTVMPTIENELDVSGIARWIEETDRAHGIGLVIIEKVSAMPGQGVSSMFKFGTCYGVLQGVVISLGFPYKLIVPRVWQKVMHVGCVGEDPKKRSLMAASRLFPKVDFRATERSKIPHDGIVDAVLIAKFGLST